ncbi:hypothetical protein [Bacillus sp. FSL L8-0152]|uniref:hypothetical protein n=1 Tax=Bacillus sp. FSL L8-0152 TaxID=2921516 RepID=UPI0030FB25AE
MFNLVRKHSFSIKEVNRILQFEISRSKFWFFEINDYGRLVREEQKDYFIYAYVNPDELTKEEEEKLEEIKGEHPEYYEGVKGGWSILLMGN